MKITKLKHVVFLFASIVFITSCSKDEVVDKKQIETKNEGFYSKSGVLIFDNEATFNSVFEATQNMSPEERERWEKELDFISYDRIHSQIAKAENELDSYYTSLSEEEVNKILASGNYKKYSDVSLEYIEMGIAKELVDENGENHLKVHEIIYSSIVNSKGLVIIDSKLYVFRNGGISEMNDFNLNEQGEIENLDISARLKAEDNTIISNRIIRTSGRTRVILSEIYGNTYWMFGTEVWYKVSGRAEKKNWLGRWDPEECYVITYGSFQAVDNGVTTNYSFNVDSKKGFASSTTTIKKFYHYSPYYPEIKNAVSITLRSGGCCGYGIRINNNDGNNPIYVP